MLASLLGKLRAEGWRLSPSFEDRARLRVDFRSGRRGIELVRQCIARQIRIAADELNIELLSSLGRLIRDSGQRGCRVHFADRNHERP